MMFGMAAASSALDLIKSLTSSQSSSKTTNKTAFSTASQTGASASSSSTASPGASNLISADTMNALFAAQSEDNFAAKSSDALKSLFKTLDADGSGKISKSQFESALGAGGTNVANADKVFGKMDADGDGNISLDEMASALKPKKAKGNKPNKPGGNVETLLQMVDNIQANAAAGLDSSLTTQASASASTSAARAYSGIEQMLQRQADLVTRNMSATSSLSVSV